jgi:hypothetical protein
MKTQAFVAPLLALAVGCQMTPGSSPAPAASPSAGSSPGAAAPSSGARPSSPSPKEPSTPEPSAPTAVLAVGTPLAVTLSTTVASDKSRPGDTVIGKLAAAVTVGERVVVPAGAEVRGEVLDAVGSGRVKGRAHLSVAFMKLVVDGKSYDLQTSPISATAASGKGKDAKIIGGSAAAGALIGAIADGGSGAAKGALIGGAAGGGATLVTKGKEVVFAAGSRHTVTLKSEVRLD